MDQTPSKDSSDARSLKSDDLDDMISRLLDAGREFTKSTGTVCLTNEEISAVCSASRELLLSEPALLEVSAPVNIVGDIHGQYTDLIRLFESGDDSSDPEKFFLLRSNQECASVTRVGGFYDECKRRSDKIIWKSFIDVFNCLPIAAVVAGHIFCVHGGLSPSLRDLDDIRAIARPTDVPDEGLLTDLLWSDPADMEEDWKSNDERGVSYCFGKRVIMDFLKRHDFDLVCRAHQVVDDGYKFYQDGNHRILVTVFSAPNYCGEFDNLGAVMSVSGDLNANFRLLQPLKSTALEVDFKKGGDKLNSDVNSSSPDVVNAMKEY